MEKFIAMKPFIYILFKPRMTMKKYIISKDYPINSRNLAVFSGIVISIANLLEKQSVLSISIISPLLLNLLFGGAILYFMLLVLSKIILFIGEWFNGNGSYNEIMDAVTWSYLPLVYGSIIKIIIIITYNINPGFFIQYYKLINYFWIFTIILGFYHIVVSIICLSEVQRINIGKSSLNYILSILTVVVFLYTILNLFKTI